MCENVFCKGSETIFTNKAFRMLTGLRHYKLLDTEMYDEWIKKYSASKYNRIANFATHLLDDISAVRNAVCFDYSNGIAEGFNNKIKAIKREMYGRATKVTKNRKRCWFGFVHRMP